MCRQRYSESANINDVADVKGSLRVQSSILRLPLLTLPLHYLYRYHYTIHYQYSTTPTATTTATAIAAAATTDTAITTATATAATTTAPNYHQCHQLHHHFQSQQHNGQYRKRHHSCPGPALQRNDMIIKLLFAALRGI